MPKETQRPILILNTQERKITSMKQRIALKLKDLTDRLSEMNSWINSEQHNTAG